VLHIDESADAGRLLRFRRDMQAERGLARAFRPIDLGDAAARHTADAPLPAVVPVNGATDVATSWPGWESPNPAPGALRPFGPAISLQFGLNDDVEWGEAGLYGPDGASITTARTTSQWRRALSLVPHDPLAPATTYTVRVNGTRNGEPFAVETSFTTRQA